MRFSKCFILAALLAAGSAALKPEAPLASPTATPSVDPSVEAESKIFERQQVMIALGKDSETLGDIVAGLQPAAKLPAVTQSIAAGAREARDSFREVIPGGRTKPAAWADQADFNRRLDAFARNAETMAAAGAKGDVVAVTGLMVEAMPCKECHDLYREPKKPG